MKNLLKNELGFSLAEIMVAAGLTAGLAYASVHFMGVFSSTQREFEDRSDKAINERMVYRFFSVDFAHAFPSLNYAIVDSEVVKGNCPNKNFWTLSKSIQHTTCHHEIHLDEDGEEFTIIDKVDTPTVNFSPAEFYITSGSELQFNRKKVKAFLDKNEIKGELRIMKIESPGYLEGKKRGVQRNYASLVFSHKDAGLKELKLGPEIGFVKEPFNEKCNSDSSTLDLFLRCLPRQGDSATANLFPVNIIKYQIRYHDKEKPEEGFDLFRLKGVVQKGKLKYQEFRIGQRISKVTIRRPNITQPNIAFNVETIE